MCETSNSHSRLVLWEVRDYLNDELKGRDMPEKYTSYISSLVDEAIERLGKDNSSVYIVDDEPYYMVD